MDIRRTKGDITTVDSGFIGHGVNCQGVMGAGVALTVKLRWPNVFDDYVSLCSRFLHITSRLLGEHQVVRVTPKLYVANLFTQDFYGSSRDGLATQESIYSALMGLSSEVISAKIPQEMKRIHLPEIGGKRGGLDFETEVMPVIEKVAASFDSITYIVWTYDGDINA